MIPFTSIYISKSKGYKHSKTEASGKLPSKRALAKHLSISTITVENAYNQLAVEGYIYSVPRSGFLLVILLRVKLPATQISAQKHLFRRIKSRTGPQSTPVRFIV